MIHTHDTHMIHTHDTLLIFFKTPFLFKEKKLQKRRAMGCKLARLSIV